MRVPPQLYNEEVNDLLAPEGARLQIHESREAGVYVAGLREEIVTSAARTCWRCWRPASAAATRARRA